jgi:phage-related protein (TIGR01555 family)
MQIRLPWSRPALPAPAPEPDDAAHPFSDARLQGRNGRALLESWRKTTLAAAPRATVAGAGMDADDGFCDPWAGAAMGNAPDALFSWFGQQGFLGHQLAPILAQHWFIDKACTMPARDAIRHGFTVSVPDVAASRQDKTVAAIHKANKRLRLMPNLLEYVRMGRVFGVRVAIFQVENPDPDYYELPFNPDSVTPGSYRGIVQVDPYWCTPLLDMSAASSPDDPHFYDPTYWIVNGRKYHRSHLAIFRNSEVADILKPAYLYGGISVPQIIMERVYAAERTANEAPQLALSKRLTVYKTDLAKLVASKDGGARVFNMMTWFRDNWGQRVVNTDEEMTQLETSLTDLDDIIMGQYVLACAAARVPVTKMMGTAPKGLNATGEYDEASYHEDLESIQSNDLDPFLEGHFIRLSRSEFKGVEITTDWNPLDSPTAKEYAEIDEIRARGDKYLAEAGAIDGEDIRQRLRNDRTGVYTDLTPGAPEEPPVTASAGTPGEPAVAADAEPRPLYVYRKLLNAADLVAWAKAQGLPALPDDLHVTVTYSRTAVDWTLIEPDWNQREDGRLIVPPGGMRMIGKLGLAGEYAVLHFASSNLSWRHEQMKQAGASFDFDQYQPHITLGKNWPSVAEAALAYQGELIFGPETFEDLKL